MAADRPALLSAALRSPDIAVAPGVHDVFSARIVEEAGHRSAYLGGNAMALGLGKGQPFVTISETVEITARIARATGLALLVDAGAGFGAAPHLHLAVRDIEAAGAGGLHIDDQPYPKMPGYHRGKGTVIEPAEMAVRIQVAVAARRSSEFQIVARTDALRVTQSLDAAIDRCGRLVEAGADALMILDLDPGNVGAVRNALPATPLIWIGGVVPPIPSIAELATAGFALACYPFNGIAEVSARLGDLWRGLQRTGHVAQEDMLLTRARKETLDLTGMPALWDIEDGHFN